MEISQNFVAFSEYMNFKQLFCADVAMFKEKLAMNSVTAKRSKLKNSCSQLWLIVQLYVELGLC